MAAERGYAGVVRVLLDRGADASAADRTGRMPLHLAVLRGHTDVVRLLLEHGADVNGRDRHGKPPLRLAAEVFGETR